MKVYTFSEARQHFASVLELAQKQGCVQITRCDGGIFNIQPVASARSPLDVDGISLGLDQAEIVASVREGRERDVGS